MCRPQRNCTCAACAGLGSLALSHPENTFPCSGQAKEPHYGISVELNFIVIGGADCDLMGCFEEAERYASGIALGSGGVEKRIHVTGTCPYSTIVNFAGYICGKKSTLNIPWFRKHHLTGTHLR